MNFTQKNKVRQMLRERIKQIKDTGENLQDLERLEKQLKEMEDVYPRRD
jgi:cell shape-determining protein MreC